MRRIALLIALLAAFTVVGRAQTYEKIQGSCTQGGQTVTTDGRQSTTKVDRSYPNCTVTVYVGGTLTLASIASNSTGTPKSNPFTADSDGYWSWYALDGTYDVKISGAGLTAPITRSGYWIVTSGGGGSGITGSGTANRFPIFSSSTVIADSVFKQVGTSEFKAAATGKRINLDTGSQQTVEIANASITGTTANRLAKLTGAPSTLTTLTTSDTTGIVGIVAAGAGTTGNAQIVVAGNIACDFDGATTAGHYVGASTSSAGKCTDLGATRPATPVQVIGRVLETIASAGSATVYVFVGEQGAALGISGSGSNSYLTQWTGTSTVAATQAFYDGSGQEFTFQKPINIITGATGAGLLFDLDQVVINGSATRTTTTDMIKLKAVAAQTGDFIEADNSGGSAVFKIRSNGQPTFGGLNYTFPAYPGSTQCLQISSTGVISTVACVTGNVPFQVQAYNVINDGGCTGNGVANDTSCVAASYTAAIAAGRPLYFPAGTYLVDGDTIIIATNSVTIFGDGPSRSTIKNRTNGSTITLDNTPAITHSVTIRDLSLSGAGGSTADIGITVSGTANEPYGLTVSNVTIGNMGGKGIYVSNNLFTSRFVDVDVSVLAGGSNGIDISGGADIVIENSYVHTVGTNGAAYRIHAGVVTMIGDNGIDSGTTADWLVLGDSTGTGDPSDRYARANLIGCNIEAFTNRGVYAKSGSYVNKYEGVTFLAPATGTVTPIKYDFVDTGQRGTWDAASSINTAGATYTNSNAINSSGIPFVQIGGTSITNYYDTGATATNTLPYITTALVAGSTNAAILTSRAKITALESSGLVGDLTGSNAFTGDPARVLLQAGLVSRPTLASTDVNTTGIYFPTAGTTIGLTVSGTQRLLLGTSHTLTGNLGINTAGSGTYALDIASGPVRATNSGGSSTAVFEAKGNNNPYFLLTDTTASAILGRIQALSGAPDRLAIGAFSNHPLGLYTNSTEKWTVQAAGDFVPGAASTYNIGSSSLPVLNATLNGKLFWNGTTVFDTYGTGSPESVVTASIGSIFRRTDGGASTTFYVKTSGNGLATGWTALAGGGITGSGTSTQLTYWNGTSTVSTISGATTDATNVTFGSANLRATRPRVTTSIDDANGAQSLLISATASAVNQFTVVNAATTGHPSLTASGSDSNINVVLTPKGTGTVSSPAQYFDLTANTAAAAFRAGEASGGGVGAIHPGTGGGFSMPFIGGGQSGGPGIWWTNNAYNATNGIWLSNGFNFQGASSTHSPLKIRTGTGTSSDGTIRFTFAPDSSLFTQNASTGATGSTTDVEVVDILSTGTAGANFGAARLYTLENGSGSQTNAARLGVSWTTATAAAETSRFDFSTNLAGGGLGTVFSIEGNQYYGTLSTTGSLSGGITINALNGNVQQLTLTGNVTSTTLSNFRSGGIYVLDFIQGNVGSNTLSSTNIKVEGGSLALTATVGAHDLFTCYSNGTNLYCSKALDVK